MSATDLSDILGVPRGAQSSITPIKHLKSPLMINATGYLTTPLQSYQSSLNSGIKEKRKIHEHVQKWKWSPFITRVRKDGLLFHHWSKTSNNDDDDDNGEIVNIGHSNFESLHSKTIKVFQYNNNEYKNLIAKLKNSIESTTITTTTIVEPTATTVTTTTTTSSDEPNANQQQQQQETCLSEQVPKKDEKSSTTTTTTIVKINSEKTTKLSDDDYLWTREETNQLFKLCKVYDLRFSVMHDRFVSCRNDGTIPTLEQMKNRYFTIARLLLQERAKKKNQLSMIENHPLMQCEYDYEYEVKRKNQTESIYHRDAEYVKREESIRMRLKQIEDIKKKRIEEEKREKLLQEKREKEAIKLQQKLERERKRQEKMRLLEESAAAAAAAIEVGGESTVVSDESAMMDTNAAAVAVDTAVVEENKTANERPKRSTRSSRSSTNVIESAPVVSKRLVNLDLVDEGTISSTSFSEDVSVVDEAIKKSKSGVHTRSLLMYSCATPEIGKRVDQVLEEINMFRPMPTLRVHQAFEEMKRKLATIVELEKKISKYESKSSGAHSKKRAADADFVPSSNVEADATKKRKKGQRGRPPKKQKK